MDISELRKDIQNLPVHERADLAYWIMKNLDETDGDNNEIEAAWRNEIRSRMAEIKDGKVRMVPSEEMWKEFLNDYEKTG
jgi:putative addiction module component (TIGR02574 family)